MNDNQFTDAAQLVASHRAAHADTATARLAQVSPDATVPQHASIDTIRFLQARIRELRIENERLRAMVNAQDALIATVYWDDNDLIDDQHVRLLRDVDDAKAALDADGEREG